MTYEILTCRKHGNNGRLSSRIGSGSLAQIYTAPHRKSGASTSYYQIIQNMNRQGQLQRVFIQVSGASLGWPRQHVNASGGARAVKHVLHSLACTRWRQQRMHMRQSINTTDMKITLRTRVGHIAAVRMADFWTNCRSLKCQCRMESDDLHTWSP